MVEKSAKSRWEEWSAALDAALQDVRAALAAGEAQEAERRAKAVSAFARAIRDASEVAEYGRALPPEEDAESAKAELRRRLARYVEADREGASVAELEQRARETLA